MRDIAGLVYVLGMIAVVVITLFRARALRLARGVALSPGFVAEQRQIAHGFLTWYDRSVSETDRVRSTKGLENQLEIFLNGHYGNGAHKRMFSLELVGEILNADRNRLKVETEPPPLTALPLTSRYAGIRENVSKWKDRSSTGQLLVMTALFVYLLWP